MTDAELQILQNLVHNSGWLPSRPVLNKPESVYMMRIGWIEAIDPPRTPGRSKSLPYVVITDAGRAALAAY